MVLSLARLVNADSKSTYLSSIELLTCSENQTKWGRTVLSSGLCPD